MSNVDVTVRVSPCKVLLTGVNSDSCRPGDDIVNPVAIQSAARAKEIGQQALYADGNKWIFRQITTSLDKEYRWGDTFVVDTPKGRKVGIVGPVQHNLSGDTQSFYVKYIG